MSVRRAYSRTTLIDTDHVYWMTTSNQAQMTKDLAKRSIITRLPKRPHDTPFKDYKEGSLLKHVEAQSDYYLSCIFAIIRHWHEQGKPVSRENRHDFREWSQAIDWIIQKIFGLPALLDGHRSEQCRVSSVGLNFLRDLALAVKKLGECGKNLAAVDLASICDSENISIPGCPAVADNSVIARRVGQLLGPLFRESESREIDGFSVERAIRPVYDKQRQEIREHKRYCFKEKQPL